MDKPNVRRSSPLNLAKSSVLKPIIKHMAKITSKAVAIVPRVEIIASGNQGFIAFVYSKKLSQFPHAETVSGQNPNLSATADKKPAEMVNRKKILIMFLFILKIVKTKLAKDFILISFYNSVSV